MARLTRQILKVFGLLGTNDNFGQFGSQAAGLPINTKDIGSIQALAAWDNGIQDSLSASKAPYLDDTNGVYYVHSYQLAYLLQQGIPEWNSQTTYYALPNPSIVQANNGQWFQSLQDNNLNNAPPVGASDAFWLWINPPIPTVPGIGNALKAALIVANNGGAPATKIDVDADLLSVQGVSLAAVNLTADITVSGANGIDAGAAANNTWYAVHVITNADGTLVASLLSLSASAPTLPAGYTKFRRVGWARRAVGTFLLFQQFGDWVTWTDPTALTQLNLATGTASFASFGVPPSCKLANFQFSAAYAGIVGNNGIFAKVTGTSMPTVEVLHFVAGFSTQVNCAQMALSAGQQIDFTNSSASTWSVTTLGYYDPA